MSDKSTSLGILAVVVAVLALLIAVVPIVMDGGDTPGMQEDTLSVRGTSTIETSPDEVQIDVGVETKGATTSEVQNANKEISDNIIEALKNLGVTDDEMESVVYRLDEWNDWSRDEGQKHKGYIQRHTLRVTTDKLDLAGQIADAAVKAGGNNVGRINFQLSKEKREELTNKALAEATSKAKAKAETMAKPLGMRIGGIVSISDNSNDYYPRPMYAEAAVMKAGGPMEDVETQILPGTLEITGRVNVVFKLK